MLARRKIGTGAAIATGVILAAVLTGSASAGTPTPGCHGDANAGAHGVKCVDKVTDVLAGVHVAVPPVVAKVVVGTPVVAKVVVGTPSCPDATASLVQAKVIVGGLNGKGGTAAKLAEAQEASNKAHKAVRDAEGADNTEDAKDAAITTAQGHVTAANTELTNAKALPDDVPPAHAKAHAIAKAQGHVTAANTELTNAEAADTEAGTTEDPNDTEDAGLAVAKSNAFDVDQRLHKAQVAEGAAEQGIVDAEVVIGQACKTPVVIPPAPPADSPAPQPPVITGGNPGPITIINGQAPAPQIVQGNLPVTG